MTSPDGVAWTAAAAPFAGFWQGVAAGDGSFMAISSLGTPDRSMVSTDRASWSALAGANTGSNWETIAYGDGKFVDLANGGIVLIVLATLPTTTTSTTTSVTTRRWSSSSGCCR